MVLEQRYSPNQPRAPAGSREGGRWTSGGGGTGADGEDQYALIIDPNVVSDAGGLVEPAQAGYLIDLTDEKARGGHAIERHVGKSDEFLLNRVRTEQYQGALFDIGLQAAGSFPSLEAANKLVSSTLSFGRSIVESVVNGTLGGAKIEKFFSTPTGREAFANSGRSHPYIRDTFGVRVFIRRDERSPNGFTIVTAYPFNEGD
jgi:hypothetical protein